MKHRPALIPALILIGVLVVVGLILGSLVVLIDIAETNRSNGHRVVDCTTPGGDCYEQGRRATGEAVANINDVTIAAVVCAEAHDGMAAIQECVRKALTR